MSKLNSLSVFFPIFNEEKNIPDLIKSALEIIPEVALKYEIILVNDGSTDNTKKIAESFAKSNNCIKLINHSVNKGYGAALKTGIQNSNYNWIFFTDSDLQFDLNDLKLLIPHSKEYKIIVGYRKNRADKAMRSINAKLYKFFIDLLFNIGIKDIDCAFKLFNSKLVKSQSLFSNSAFTNAELLYKIQQEDVEIKEVAISHHPRKYGRPTGAKFHVITAALVDSIKLYFNASYK